VAVVSKSDFFENESEFQKRFSDIGVPARIRNSKKNVPRGKRQSFFFLAELQIFNGEGVKYSRFADGVESGKFPGVVGLYPGEHFEGSDVVTDFFDFFIPKPPSDVDVQRRDSFGYPTDAESLRIGIAENVVEKFVFENRLEGLFVEFVAVVSALRKIERHSYRLIVTDFSRT
jgi:hypothetical protein